MRISPIISYYFKIVFIYHVLAVLLIRNSVLLCFCSQFAATVNRRWSFMKYTFMPKRDFTYIM